MNADTQVYVPECKIFFFSNRKKWELILSLWQHQTPLIAPLTDVMGRLSASLSGVVKTKLNMDSWQYIFIGFFLRCCFYQWPMLFATFVLNCKLESLCANDRRGVVNYIHRLATQKMRILNFKKGIFNQPPNDL